MARVFIPTRLELPERLNMGVRAWTRILQDVTILTLTTLSLTWAQQLGNDDFPFGVEAGDTAISTKLFVQQIWLQTFEDNTFTQRVNFSGVSFRFMGQSYNHIYVVPGLGRVTFYKDWKPRFSRCDRGWLAPGIDVFSSDMCGLTQNNPDMVGRDVVFYRENFDKQPLSKLAQNIRAVYELDRELEWMFIVTWNDVRPRFESSRIRNCNLNRTTYVNLPTNTFQLILTTNGDQSFAMFNYKQLNWTSADIGNKNIGGHKWRGDNGDCKGLNGPVPASAGIGWMESYFALPGSCSEDILNLARNSNIQIPGRWVYRVDNELRVS